MIFQTEFTLQAKRRGCSLVSREILSKIPELPDQGLMNIFIKHTSAGLTLNENADPSVRDDFESFLNEMVPEAHPLYTHTMEGDDDMPAHLKSSLLGQSLNIPITNGRLNTGTWQGIYLCEFRNYGGPRKIVVTIYS